GSLPAGATFNQATGQFAWTPTGTQTGNRPVSFTVTDNGTPTLSDTRTVTITVANRAPTLSVPTAQTATAGQALTFVVTAADPDSGQTLTLTAGNLPAGAAFNPVSGQFAWTPTMGQVGSYTVSFTVTDNGSPALNETKTVAITVAQSNRPPVLAVPGTQTVNAGQTLTFTVTASDPDSGQTLTLTTGSLPAGATFSQSTGQFAWTPTGIQTGSYTVSFIATDSGSPVLSDTKTVAITVVNRAPTLTLPSDRVIAAGQALSFTVTAADPDTAQTLTLTAASLPPGATFSQAAGSQASGSGQFAWTPTGTQTGSYTISFTVTDNGTPALSETKNLTILVVNLAPVVTVPGPQSILTGQLLTFTVTASDPDSGQIVTLSAASLPSGAIFNQARGQFDWTPASGQAGSYTVTFTATDNGIPVLTNTKTVVITVSIPTSGTVTGIIRNAATGQPFAGASVTISEANASDTSNVNGLYTLGNLSPGVRTISVSAAGFVTSQVQLTVGAGLTVTQNISLLPVIQSDEIRITLNWTKDPNQRPQDLDAHLIVPVQGSSCYQVFFQDKGTLTEMPYAMLDVDNIQLEGSPATETIRISQLLNVTYRFFVNNYSLETRDGLSNSGATVQVFRGNIQTGSFRVPSGEGSYWNVFELNGQTGAIDLKNQLSEQPPAVCNRPPLLTVPAAQTATPGQLLSFNVTATDPDIGQILTLTASGLPVGATFNQTNGQFNWTPTGAQTGVHNVSFSVVDNGTPARSRTRSVGITVVNRAPVLTVPGVQAATTGQPMTFTVTASDADSGQSLTLTTGVLPTGATFNLTSGQFNWTPTEAQTGSFTVTFTATDNGVPQLSQTRTVTIVVTLSTPTRLAILTQPVGGASGAALATQPVVVIRDAQGNTVTSATSAVTASIFSGAGTLAGTTTVSA
ncbi:MAG: hypothetical protein EBZ36_10970, partial [Acidobacteria bacterium]|nr:hypothetical protein [Acidobacteriota bacterium]